MVGPSSLNIQSSGDCRPHLPRLSEISDRTNPSTANQGGPSNIVESKIDVLGEFINSDTVSFLAHGSWERLFHDVKGRSNFTHHLRRLPHRAAFFLDRYARAGVPVVLSSAPWTLQQKDDAIRRGNHPSVQAFQDFIAEEMTDMRRKGIFTILPYGLLRGHPALRISPLGCVPQRERRPRIINDYTFSGVNPSSTKLAPPEAMQWGRTFHRILWYIHTADQRHGPVLMSKTDLSDGFYQLPLTPSGALKLAVPFSRANGESYLAVPTRLPMGWTESPPAFSAVTETIADLINKRLESDQVLPPSHPMEACASSPVPLQNPQAGDAHPLIETGPIRPPLAYTDVYVDDFIKLAQGWRNCLRVRRTAYHCIDAVFRPNDAQDRHRKDPISVKKLAKGDDAWSTRKTILGWDIDSRTKSIHLPDHRRDRLQTLLRTMLRRRRASDSEWHTLLGELRSMALALPGSAGCFSFLQEALKPAKRRVSITPLVKDQLRDLQWLSDSLSSRPTHIAEVVPTPPTYYGAVDAAKPGMGGVWFPVQDREPLALYPQAADTLRSPILWRAPFPESIQADIVSSSNPDGSITNSDLELAGTVGHEAVLSTEVPTRHLTLCTFTDNSPTVSWRGKGSVTTTGPAAYLLQLSALHRRHHRYKTEIHFLPGALNIMADDCSRRWDLNDSQLIRYFNLTYPQPTSWQLCHLTPEMHSALTSCLHRKRSKPESFLRAPKRHTTPGPFGVRFAPLSLSTLSFQMWPIPFRSSRPLAYAGEMAASRPVKTPTELALWRMPFALSRRRSPAWGPRTLV